MKHRLRGDGVVFARRLQALHDMQDLLEHADAPVPASQLLSEEAQGWRTAILRAFREAGVCSCSQHGCYTLQSAFPPESAFRAIATTSKEVFRKHPELKVSEIAQRVLGLPGTTPLDHKEQPSAEELAAATMDMGELQDPLMAALEDFRREVCLHLIDIKQALQQIMPQVAAIHHEWIEKLAPETKEGATETTTEEAPCEAKHS